MRAVYDLDCSPPTFNVLDALVKIEIERRAQRADGIDLIFADGRKNGFRDNEDWPAAAADREDMLARVLMPAARLLPSIRTVTRAGFNDRGKLANVYGFGRRLYGFPVQMECWRSVHGRPLRYPGQIAPTPGLITITLRESPHWPQRNSNVAEWMIVANELRARGKRVVVIRDTAKADDPFGDHETMPAASRNLLQRAALYASAEQNLHINSGCAMLAVFMNAPATIFRVSEETHPASAKRYMARNGFVEGDNAPASPPWQRWRWENDTARNILAALEG